MDREYQSRLGRIQFITGSLRGLIGLAEADRLDMLIYLLEMALLESAKCQDAIRAEEP